MTSSIRIIGTISIAGRIKEKPEMHVAEKPKPLNPRLSWVENKLVNPSYFLSLKSALNVDKIIKTKNIIQTKFIVFQLVKVKKTPADKLAVAWIE